MIKLHTHNSTQIPKKGDKIIYNKKVNVIENVIRYSSFKDIKKGRYCTFYEIDFIDSTGCFHQWNSFWDGGHIKFL